MKWEVPSYIEIRMDAEIGSYQEDSDPVRDSPICSDDPHADDE